MLKKSKNTISVKLFLFIILTLSFSTLFSVGWKQIKKTKTLTIATRIKPGVYEKQGDKVSGFQYLLIKSFAKENGLKLKLKVVGWKNYFLKNNKMPKNIEGLKKSYDPDIFSAVDVIVDVITKLDYRKKIFSFIDILPSKQILITKKGKKIKQIESLNGLTVIVTKNTTYEENILKIKKDMIGSFEIKYVDSTSDQVPALLKGLGDVTVLDSNLAIVEMLKSPINLNISVSGLETICWAVKRDNNKLKKELEKYIKKIKSNGKYKEIWNSYFSIPYDDYVNILNF